MCNRDDELAGTRSYYAGMPPGQEAKNVGAADSRDTEVAEIAETEKLRRCDDRTHYWPIGDDPPAGTPCKCGARQWRPIVDHLVMVGNDGPPEALTMERDAARYRAIRDSLDRFVLTTKEGDAFCTYSATTRAEFDDAMQEFEERAEYRAASVPEGTND